VLRRYEWKGKPFMAVYRGRRRLSVLEAPDDLLQDMAQRLGLTVVDVGEARARLPLGPHRGGGLTDIERRMVDAIHTPGPPQTQILCNALLHPRTTCRIRSRSRRRGGYWPTATSGFDPELTCPNFRPHADTWRRS
jgi:hypothetical protein